MTHLETTRINDVIGLQIGAIQEFASELNVESDIEELQANLSKLEKSVAKLNSTLKALPHE
ncbi:MAG: hypothetical protein M0023_08360 [Desulfobacteraceae bacterium]|nr:hypothetical protein [Desulfobacteraceae bacterium]